MNIKVLILSEPAIMHSVEFLALHLRQLLTNQAQNDSEFSTTVCQPSC